MIDVRKFREVGTGTQGGHVPHILTNYAKVPFLNFRYFAQIFKRKMRLRATFLINLATRVIVSIALITFHCLWLDFDFIGHLSCFRTCPFLTCCPPNFLDTAYIPG